MTDREQQELIVYIANLVAEASCIPAQRICSRRRTKTLAHFRHMLFYLAYQSGLSYYRIGKLLHRHHTTVMNGVKNMEEKRAESREVDRFLARLERKL